MAESALLGGHGFRGVDDWETALQPASGAARADLILFGEGPSRIVVSFRPGDLPAVLRAAAEAGLRCLDAAIQTHGGNGMASEYGLADLWGPLRLLRIAPVSREMVLNFVAEHSLGLPKSY